MSHFDFKNLFKKLPNLTIPKELVYCGIGVVGVILFALIASNMYLQEMLFFEGVEKSVPFFTEEEIREFGDIYKDLSLDFQNEIGSYIQDYANRTNRAGEKIHYGVYNHKHPDLNTNKIHKHTNGTNITNDDNDKKSDVDDSYNDFPDASDEWATFIDSDEFKNGVNIKYTKTDEREEGESNFQDILTVMSMTLDQKGSRDGANSDNVNIKAQTYELLRKLFKMSHTFTGNTTSLYACEKGCRVLFYYCNEEDNKYKYTGIDLTPYKVNPHSDFEDYFDEDFEVHSAEEECMICGHNGKGCEQTETCYHSFNEDEENGCDHMIKSKGDCGDKAVPHYICEGHEVSDGEGGTTTEYCSDEIGEGHYHCPGHPHYDCPGHFYVCCMGHTDVTINVHIMYADEMIDVIKNGYSTIIK